MRLLVSMTDEIGVAIHNASLYETAKNHAAALEKANKVKDEFLSVMSHELRTPLNVVVGYAGMIKDGLLGEINAQQAEALDKVIRRTKGIIPPASRSLGPTAPS